MADPPGEIEDRLYVTPPDRFVTAREQAVAQAKAAGDTAAARRLAKLRRPTIAAWLVNLLAIHRPELMAQLGELASELRTAQRELRGGRLRQLSAERRTLVAALVGAARELAVAASAGLDPARLPLGEVESTLNAALSDPDATTAVTTGRLSRTVSYAGFGEVPRPRLRLVPGGAAEKSAAGTNAGHPRLSPARPGRKPDTGRRSSAAAGGSSPAGTDGVPRTGHGAAEPDHAALRQEVTAARTAARRAEADLRRAVTAERAGTDALAGIETKLAELERLRSSAEQELSRRKLARKAAERAAVAARNRVGEAEAAVAVSRP